MPSPSFPFNMRRNQSAEYLKVVHGIPITPKTLANRAAAGKGPKPKYLGTIPYHDQPNLDEFAETVFTDESPVTLARRARLIEQGEAENA